jgi:hypothetical protein
MLSARVGCDNSYLAHNPDIAVAGVNPLQHYEQSGWLEGRNPSAGFPFPPVSLSRWSRPRHVSGVDDFLLPA